MTGGQIETFIFERLQNMRLPISGKVYYGGTRPTQDRQKSSRREDIIVKVLAGTAGQIEKGSCVVNAYVPDIMAHSGQRYADRKRCDIIGAWLETLPKVLTQSGDIQFRQSDIILTLEEEATGEHFVSLKMDFKLLNTNY